MLLRLLATITRQWLAASREFIVRLDADIKTIRETLLDARGIRKRIDDFYGIDVSLELISEATSSIADKLKTWQNRRLEPVYPIISLYTHYVEIFSQERAEQRPVHLAGRTLRLYT